MDELGSLLREAREAKGLTLAEAQNVTRINSIYLEALEDGQYTQLPSEVHVRGYLKNYAKYLDLDPKPLLDRYELNKRTVTPRPELEPREDISSSKPLPIRDDQVFFDPVNVELSARKTDSGSWVRIIIIIALIGSIALIASRVVPLITGDGDGNSALTSGLEEVVGNITNNNGDAEATPTTDLGIIPGAGEPITSTERNDAIQLPTPAPTRPQLPATLETIRLKLEATERTWMRVTIDGEVVYEGLARKGDEPYEWEAQDEATLLTGNAIGLFVTINDIPIGRLGDRGEVVEETWTAAGSQ